MNAPRFLLASAFAATLAAVTGCVLNDKVSGGSSEVDNPIVVAFTDASGQSLEVTGSLSIYLADQNPSVDPEPILRKQLAGAVSVRLTGADFTQGVHLDSARAYNMLLLSGDSSGTLLREVRFDPRTGRYTFESSERTSVKLAPARLVRYAAILTGIDTGIVRVFVPGSPFQTVLVDSQFVFDAVPEGDLPFSVVLGDLEIPLVRDSGGGGPRHRLDSTKPPRQNPPPHAPDSLGAFAGPDVSIYLSASGVPLPFTLNGGVAGVDPEDPRLAVHWKQVNDSGPRVQLQNRTSRQAKTTFTEPGAYRFVFSASYGPAKAQDTVRVSVQPAPSATVFSAPPQGFVLYLDEPFTVAWYSPRADTLELQYRADSLSGAWQSLAGSIVTQAGMNYWNWTPAGPPAQPAHLRLVKLGATVSMSPGFTVVRRAPPP